MPNASSAPRRTPRQTRSVVTVDAIFEAVARIVAQHGEGALTTNRIAELAGVSVGSLYQYFPSKEAILAAMLDQHCNRVMLELDALIAQASQEGWAPELQVRRYVRHYLEAFGGGAPETRAMARLHWQLDYRASMLVSVRGTSERLALHLQRMAQEHHLSCPTPAQLFVLTRAFMGAVRAASLEQSPLLGSRDFEQALVSLCWGVLQPGGALQGPTTMAQ